MEQEQTKQLISKTMEDIKKFEKYSQEDQKKLTVLKVKLQSETKK